MGGIIIKCRDTRRIWMKSRHWQIMLAYNPSIYYSWRAEKQSGLTQNWMLETVHFAQKLSMSTNMTKLSSAPETHFKCIFIDRLESGWGYQSSIQLLDLPCIIKCVYVFYRQPLHILLIVFVPVTFPRMTTLHNINVYTPLLYISQN